MTVNCMATTDILHQIEKVLTDNHILEAEIEFVRFLDKEVCCCGFDDFKNMLVSSSQRESICWKHLYDCKIVGNNWYIEYDRKCKWCLRQVPERPSKIKKAEFDVFFREIPLYDSSDDL